MELSCKAVRMSGWFRLRSRDTNNAKRCKMNGHSVVIGSTHCRHSRLSLSISLSLLVSFIHNNYTHSRTFTLKRQKGNMQNELGDRRDEIERERESSFRPMPVYIIIIEMWAFLIVQSLWFPSIAGSYSKTYQQNRLDHHHHAAEACLKNLSKSDKTSFSTSHIARKIIPLISL